MTTPPETRRSLPPLDLHNVQGDILYGCVNLMSSTQPNATQGRSPEESRDLLLLQDNPCR